MNGGSHGGAGGAGDPAGVGAGSGGAGLGARAWLASTLESVWHATTADACGGSIVAACGHRVRGPVHRVIAPRPPADAQRAACLACVQATGVDEPRLSWPTEDPDGDTKRRTSLQSALEAHPYDTPRRKLWDAA